MLGSFELGIPVKHAKDLLPQEEDKLAFFRHVQNSIEKEDRWAPVLERYVEQIAERVRGFGGDPDKIEPSPNGARQREAGRSPSSRRRGCLIVVFLAAVLVWLLRRKRLLG